MLGLKNVVKVTRQNMYTRNYYWVHAVTLFLGIRSIDPIGCFCRIFINLNKTNHQDLKNKKRQANMNTSIEVDWTGRIYKFCKYYSNIKFKKKTS